MQRRLQVSPRDGGKTLLAFLREQCGEISSVKGLKRRIEGRHCTVNGQVETFSTFRLRSGDRVVLETAAPRALSSLKPVLLWEDTALRIYDKPAGVVCTPAAFRSSLQRKDARLVHRLDKETSGVVVVARSEEVLDRMIELFRSYQVEKTYLALVQGVVRKREGVIVSRLSPIHRYEGQTVYGSHPRGRYAETAWRTIGHGPHTTLLECRPKTGRTHQIRVHLQQMHHPLVGDLQYGKREKGGAFSSRHLLHAYALQFPHPLTHETLSFCAPLPGDFVHVLQQQGMGHLARSFCEKEIAAGQHNGETT